VPHRAVLADLADPLPAGRYDAVVTALAVHHLDDAGKRSLYRRVADALAPGGVFVNAEQVAGPTPELDRRYHEVWLARPPRRLLLHGVAVCRVRRPARSGGCCGMTASHTAG
jgi:SAM-dependent methyltransferase